MSIRLVLIIVCAVALAVFAATIGCGETGSPAPEAAAMTTPNEITLPAPSTTGGMSLTEALAKRRSVRHFAPEPLTLEQISQLAWAAQGLTDPEHGRRTAPSAGATYPMELYLCMQEGVFRYLPQGHKLARVAEADRRQDLAKACWGQHSVAEAALDVVIAGVFARTEAKYGERARQYVYQEAGHIAQNLHLQAVALGLGSVPVGAFREEAITEVLNLPAGQTALCVIPIGKPAK